MLGDGKTSYNQGEDGEPNAIAACSVRSSYTSLFTTLSNLYLNLRRASGELMCLQRFR